MTAPLPRVTDHAVLRYLERSCGIDVDFIRRRIAEICAPAAAAGAASVSYGDVKFEISPTNRTVVTCTPSKRLVTPTKVKAIGGRKG